MKILRSPNLARGDDGIMVQITKGRNFARGGLVTAANKVRGAGRYGDTMLVHINPEEFAQLKRAWGEPHYNPDTQLPEFFDWWDAAKTVAPYVLGAFGKKANVDQANQNPAPPVDPNMTTHLGTGTNTRTAAFTNHEDPKSYYTYGQTGGERQFFNNNSLGAVKYTPGAQIQPKLQQSPSTGQALLGGLGAGALQYIMKDPKGAFEAVKGLFGGSSAAAPAAAANTTTYGSLGALGGTPSGIGAGGSLVGTGGAAAAGADAAGAGAAGGSGLLPGSIAGADMADTAAYTPSIIEASTPGSAAGSGLGATLGGVGAAVGLAVLGKHMQDNTAGLGYNDSRQLAAGLAANANNPDPTHGRGKYANTPMPAPPQGFKTWNQYFYATQMIQQAMHASGGAKDQGTYRMLFQEAGIPSDPAFYMQAHPGQDVAWQTIMGPNGVGTSAPTMHGRARGGLIQRFDMGGLAQAPMMGAPGVGQPQLGATGFGATGNAPNAFQRTMPGVSYMQSGTLGAPTHWSYNGQGGILGGSGPQPPMMGGAGMGGFGQWRGDIQGGAPQKDYGGGQVAGSRDLGPGEMARMAPAPGAPGGGPPPMSGAPGGLGQPQLGRPQLPPMPAPPSQNQVPPPSAMPPAPPPSRPQMQMPPRMLWSGNDRGFPGQRRFDTGGPVSGPGTGISDQIPARLSDGEYVIPAHIVAALGDGSTAAGAKRLDELQRQVRRMTGRQMAKNRHPKASPPPIALIGDQK